jgi:hypothetical protein
LRRFLAGHLVVQVAAVVMARALLPATRDF